MGLVIFSFLAVFVLVLSAGVLLFFRDGMAQRLSSVISPNMAGASFLVRLKAQEAGHTLKAAIQPFEKVLPKTTEEVSIAQKRLIRAGYREDQHVRIFYGAKVLVPITLCLLAAITDVSSIGPFFVYAVALGLGYLAPDFWLGNQITRRQTEVRLGLPDFLDFMVVCIEAGLSLDQALLRSTDELHATLPEITDEIGLVLLEQKAGRLRVEAWKHLAERVDTEVVRTLVTSIIQAEQFGTSISKTLRMYSDTIRVKRRQEVEELAGKMAVKLVFPLVFFIFPALFVVALGPSAITLMDIFQKYFSD